ncbi:MAG: chemotaxis protein CheA [Myxococcota bacterium]
MGNDSRRPSPESSEALHMSPEEEEIEPISEIVVSEEPEMLSECVDESLEHLANAENAILELEQEPTNEHLVNTVFRSFHTVKGIAGFLELVPVTRIAHRSESILALVRSGEHKFGGADGTALLDAVDFLRRTLESVRDAAVEDGSDVRVAIDPEWVALYYRLEVEDHSDVETQPDEVALEIPPAVVEPPASSEPTSPEPPASAESSAVESPASSEPTPPEPPASAESSAVESPVPAELPAAEPMSPEPPASAESTSVEVAEKASQSVTKEEETPKAPEEPKSETQTHSKKGADTQQVSSTRQSNSAKTAAKKSTGSAAKREAFVRVRTDRLDQLLDTVGELVIAQTMVLEQGRGSSRSNAGLVEQIVMAGKIVRELQDLTMSLRMVPMSSTFQRMSRVIRDVASKQAKRVQMQTTGDDTEIDRTLVDLLAEPLIHMIRNSVDHGIETPEHRVRLGKNPTGTIHLSAASEAGRIVIRISDDGKGLDRQRILEKATERGLIEPSATLPDSEVFKLIFEPGFSTASQVTDVSGRGVGMDVVRKNVEALRGWIGVASEQGRGTTITIKLPLTLAITDGMVVRVGEERYILPTLNIVMSFRPTRSMLVAAPGRGEFAMLRGEPLPLIRLYRVFEVEGAVEDPSDALIVVMQDGDVRYALLVDEVIGQQQVVTKGLELGRSRSMGLGGAAILGDGRVGLIVDTAGLAQQARREVQGARRARVA